VVDRVAVPAGDFRRGYRLSIQEAGFNYYGSVEVFLVPGVGLAKSYHSSLDLGAPTVMTAELLEYSGENAP
jgi:hypothetical protein